MAQPEGATEEVNPRIAFNRRQATLESDLAKIAAETIGFADVGINVTVDRSRRYPSLNPPRIFIRRRDHEVGDVNVNFTYSTHTRADNMVDGRARLQQSVHSGELLTVVNDFIDMTEDLDLVRRRKVEVTGPRRQEIRDTITIKPARPRTILAMARLAAYHARTASDAG